MSASQTVPSVTPPRARERLLETVIDSMERGWIPDWAIRLGIGRLCSGRLSNYVAQSAQTLQDNEQIYLKELMRSPVAVHTKDANQQHYEVPSEFFNLVLGPNRKYSCSFWDSSTQTLAQAEQKALEVTMQRADLADGMSVLELGCGWGSLTLAMAAKFPRSHITAVSNSRTQKLYIEEQARQRGLANIQILTRDISLVEDMAAEFGQFDRAVSVEMFEHFRNYGLLMERISKCLKTGGKLFVHIFTHREHSYFFDTEGEDNWMGKYFFTGGQMPSRFLLRSFQRNLQLTEQWSWNGEHYAKTSNAWLANLDTNHAQVLAVLKDTYGEGQAKIWLQRWRIFFMACAELFAYQAGTQWFVSHYLFEKRI